MKLLSGPLRGRIEAEEKYNILKQLQMEEQMNYPFLSPPKLVIRQYRAWLEQAGVVLIAMLTAAVSVIANYFVFVRILHVQF